MLNYREENINTCHTENQSEWELDFCKQPPEVFCKKGVFTNFTKFTGKKPVPEPLFNKVAGFIPATLLKKTLWHRCFPVNFMKFLKAFFVFIKFLQTTKIDLLSFLKKSGVLLCKHVSVFEYLKMKNIQWRNPFQNTKKKI